MGSSSLVYGLVHPKRQAGRPAVVTKLRDLTLTWSRYDYRGPVIERSHLDGVLDEAHAQGFRYCFVQFTGHVISEERLAVVPGSRGFVEALVSWARTRKCLVGGTLTGGGRDGCGLEPHCLLVDVRRHRQLGAPSFDRPGARPTILPHPEIESVADRPAGVRSSKEYGPSTGTRFGANVVAVSLAHGISVPPLRELIGPRSLWLGTSGRARAAFGRYLGPRIATFRPARPDTDLTTDQARFLASVGLQATRARRGVFLFNVEAYDDVAVPPPGFTSPVSTLYAVAAGFKPNRILETHGFDSHTRVVFFDYSRTALAIRKRLVQDWDGRDFPAFAEHLTRLHRPPRTLYQAWAGLDAPELREGLQRAWAAELTAWGGAKPFIQHWRRYRCLPHDFVHCDIVADPTRLVRRIRSERSAVIWWSNAFFTMYANWLLDIGRRRAGYQRWIRALAAKNPTLFLYGADDVNSSVNAATAKAYWARFRERGRDVLRPCRVNRIEIRS